MNIKLTIQSNMNIKFNNSIESLYLKAVGVICGTIVRTEYICMVRKKRATKARAQTILRAK